MELTENIHSLHITMQSSPLDPSIPIEMSSGSMIRPSPGTMPSRLTIRIPALKGSTSTISLYLSCSWICESFAADVALKWTHLCMSSSIAGLILGPLREWRPLPDNIRNSAVRLEGIFGHIPTIRDISRSPRSIAFRIDSSVNAMASFTCRPWRSTSPRLQSWINK